MAKKTNLKASTEAFLQTTEEEIHPPAGLGWGTWVALVFISLVVGAGGSVAVKQPSVRAALARWWPAVGQTTATDTRVVVEKREEIKIVQEEQLRRLLADAGGRVARIMKGDDLLSLATLIAQDGGASWFVAARAWESGAAVTTTDGLVLTVREVYTDVFTGLTFLQTDLAGARPYVFSESALEHLSVAVGTTVVWLAPQDGFGAPFVEAQTVRGLYGGADQPGLFPLNRNARRLDTTAPAPFPGLPAVNLAGSLIGVADQRGLLVPGNAVMAAWRLRKNKSLDMLAKSNLRYYPSVGESGEFTFKIVKKDNSLVALPATVTSGFKPVVGDDLVEFLLATALAPTQASTALLNFLTQQSAIKSR